MKITLVFLVLFSFTAKALPTDNFQLLKDRRATLVLPTYTLQDKKTVVDQARLILNEVFVHRALKLQDFGQEVDPSPMLDQLEAAMDKMDEATFHTQMSRIFQKIRDLHTTYQLPSPYLCYRTLLPVEFKEVMGLDGEKVIAVKTITEEADVLKLVGTLRPQVGDVLISYDGSPVENVLAAFAPFTAGANPASSRRISVSQLGFRSQKYSVIPAKDTVELTLRSRFGKIYTTTLPWISKENTICTAPKPQTLSIPKNNMAENDYQNDLNRLFRQQEKPKSSNKDFNSELKKSADPILSSRIIENEFGRFGLFRLESFVPEKISSTELVLEFKKILQTEFADTDGVIIDLRDNGGGYIDIAEGLVELFTPKNIAPLGFRLRATAANTYYLKNSSDANAFYQAILAATQAGAPFTANLPLNSVETMNKLGQSYFKPVALLNNAGCYSSCDMFSAQMQDHAAAVVFGEDPNTGAGGANNVQLAAVLKSLGDHPGPFQKMPSGQNIGFAWRQSIRVGVNAGKLIEDVGVIADFQAPAGIADLYTRSEDQFKIISKKLNQLNPSYSSSVAMNTDGRFDLVVNETLAFFAKWEQTSSVVFKNKGRTIGTEEIELDNVAGRSIRFPDNFRTEELKLDQVEILGMLGEKRVWRKVFNYRTIPASTTLDAAGLILDFETAATAPLTFYTTKANEGWTVKDHSMRVGSDPYADDFHTEASLFLKLPGAFKLSFDASVDSEEKFDYLQVILVSEGKEVALIEKISGKVELKHYEADLSAYAGKTVEIRFVFDADNGVSGKGPVLDNIRLSP